MRQRSNVSVAHLTATEIAQLVNGEVLGCLTEKVSGFSGIKEAQKGDLTFLAHPKYESLLGTTRATVVLVSRNISCPGKTLIRVENPSLSFSHVVDHLLKDACPYKPQGIHPSAVISPKAQLAQDVAVGPHCVIEDHAVIEKGCCIYAGCYVGQEAFLNEGCLLYPHVVVRDRSTIGKRVIIHSGTIIGADGFGYVTVDGKHTKIPQVGTVVIEDDVEIGALVTIDRARFDVTLIGEGTKIDNLVQIAHNVTVGKHCLIVAQSGIAGSTKIGDHVVLAAQSGLVGHIEIGDRVVVGAQSGVSKSVKAGEQVFGSPAQAVKEAFRNHAHVQRLDQYVAKIKELERRLAELEKNI